MKGLENLSLAQLYQLAREKEISENKVSRPKVVLNNNCSENIELIALAESYMDDEEEGREVDTNFAYEALMEVVYGKGIFDYINSLR